MDVELKPCPFCGGEPKFTEVGSDLSKSRKLTIQCKGCRFKLTNAAIRHGFDWLYEITITAWNNRHGAGDAEERLRDLHDSIRTVYDAVPGLPIDETTMDAATDALHAFCLLVGIHKVDIDTPRDDAARAGERG